MNYLNLETRTKAAPEYIGSTPIQRATWLNVILWAAEQENGGRIANCEAWSSRRWQQTCGVTAREVRKCPRLLLWDGADLTIWSYPLSHEKTAKSRRENAQRVGHLGGRPSQDKPSMGPLMGPSLESVREEKEIKGEEKSSTPAAFWPDCLPDAEVADVAKATGRRPDQIRKFYPAFRDEAIRFKNIPYNEVGFAGLRDKLRRHKFAGSADCTPLNGSTRPEPVLREVSMS